MTFSDSPIALAEEAEALLLAEVKPFQVFVRTVAGKTVVLNDIELDTPIAKLRELAAAKEHAKMPPEELRLVSGGKELADGKVASDYGIGPESTLHALLRLRGGYGETSAVGFTLDKGIRRGNNGDTIKETEGRSLVHKNWGRSVKGNSQFHRIVRQTLSSAGIRADRKWFDDNWIHIASLVQEVSGGGNCGDFAQIVHSRLVATTKDQYVYEIVMGGGWDHQLCVTYPSKVAKLADMDPDIATIADGWDNYMVIPLRDLLNGTNCYGAKIKNLDTCPTCGEGGKRGNCQDDKEECDNHLYIVASQECTESGGLTKRVKDELEGVIQRSLDSYMETPQYKEALKEALKDKRGIFRFRVEDSIQDDRSHDDIMAKLEGLLKLNEATLLNAELLDLSQAQLLRVCGASNEWRDMVLGIEDARVKCFPFMEDMDEGDLLPVLNALTDEQFMQFFSHSDDSRAKVLSIAYARQRLYTLMTMRSESELGDFLLELDEAEVIKYYDASPSAPASIYGSAVALRRLFHVLTVADTADLERIVAVMPRNTITKFWLFSDESREAIMGNAAVSEAVFAMMEAEPKAFLRIITVMKPAQVRAFAASSPSRREMIAGEERFAGILDG